MSAGALLGTVVRAAPETDGVLRSRGPAYAVIERCLHAQATAAPRGPVARVLGVDPLHPDARRWYAGALGELAVAAELARLGPEWTVLHAVPIGDGDSDIDHVVLGPAGVFTLTTKHHRRRHILLDGDTFLVDGRRTGYFGRSQIQARRAFRALAEQTGRRQWVTPVIVVVGARALRRGRRSTPVEVVTRAELVGWLTSRQPRIGRAALARLLSEASRRATWHRDAERLDDLQRHRARFERLRHEVEVAARRRRIWRVLAGVAVASVALCLAAPLLPAVGRTLVFLTAGLL